MRKALLLLAAMMTIPSAVRAEGIDSLVEVGKSMSEISAAMDRETKSFDRVSAGVAGGAIRKGISKDAIIKNYGEPVITNTDSVTGRERWAYKPAASTFFKGKRIYLLFDKNGALDEIKTAE